MRRLRECDSKHRSIPPHKARQLGPGDRLRQAVGGGRVVGDEDDENGDFRLSSSVERTQQMTPFEDEEVERVVLNPQTAHAR